MLEPAFSFLYCYIFCCVLLLLILYEIHLNYWRGKQKYNCGTLFVYVINIMFNVGCFLSYYFSHWKRTCMSTGNKSNCHNLSMTYNYAVLCSLLIERTWLPKILPTKKFSILKKGPLHHGSILQYVYTYFICWKCAYFYTCMIVKFTKSYFPSLC